MEPDLDGLSDQYERAEAAFLQAVRAGDERQAVARMARTVADAAGRFNAEAYRRLHDAVEADWMQLDALTERTEVLAELWADLAAAYDG